MAVSPDTLNGKRFFRPGELPLVILTLLQDKPANGYQLLVRLQQMFAPEYEPSTGSVYPALAALESEGLIRSDVQERTKTFVVTDTGATLLERQRDVVARVENRTQRRLRRDGSVDAAVARFIAVIHELDLPTDEVELILERAVRSLRRAQKRGMES